MLVSYEVDYHYVKKCQWYKTNAIPAYYRDHHHFKDIQDRWHAVKCPTFWTFLCIYMYMCVLCNVRHVCIYTRLIEY